MMVKFGAFVVCGAMLSAQATLAQEVDCADPANAEEIACLNLPEGDQPITNFVPFVAPLLGAAVLGVIGGSGSTTSTSSTTSTTSTTGG